jgi:hypothetical protein
VLARDLALEAVAIGPERDLLERGVELVELPPDVEQVLP